MKDMTIINSKKIVNKESGEVRFVKAIDLVTILPSACTPAVRKKAMKT